MIKNEKLKNIMAKYYFYYLFSVIIIIKIAKGYEICNNSFSCSNDQTGDDYCLSKYKTNSPGIYDVILNSNFNNTLSCDVNNGLLYETEITISSKPNDNQFIRPSYINGSCTNNSQCLFGICQNSKCKTYHKCFSHEQCPLNTFCNNTNNSCIPLLEDDKTCQNSYECQFNSYCDQSQHRCKKLFSIEDDENIGQIKGDFKNYDEICKSGGYNKIDEKNIKCQTLYNINYECDDDICRYKYKNSNLEKSINENCLCGYNKHRKKYCVLGNGEKEYIDFLNIRKKFLFNENYIKKCHTLERDTKEICNELINTEKSLFFRNFVKQYNNLKIKALEYHRIKGADPCIKNVIFGYDINPVIPSKQKCPKYSCNSSLPVCLLGYNSFTEKDDITITLNSEICAINENCILTSDSDPQNFLQIMSKEKIMGTCSIYSHWTGDRYPGEDCNIDNDCFLNFKCQNGKCLGFNKGDNCTETYQCSVGLYCNQETKKCSEQKKEGEKCKDVWDCKNYLGCYRGRCIKLGILKPGVINNEKTSPFSGSDKRNLLCTTGEIDSEYGYCVETKYNEKWMKENNKKIDNNGFITCDYDEDCVYDNGKKSFIKKCGCGYNNNGQGYCPLPNNQNKEKWNERVKNLANIANNNCHSFSRFNCYLQNSLDDYKDKIKYDKDTIYAHLFYNAIPCAKKMFSSYKYLTINFFSLFILCFIFNY